VSKEFSITVTIKAPSQRTCCGMKFSNGTKDAVQQEILKTKQPLVLCCVIDEDESIAKLANREAVAKHNVHVDHIEVAVLGPLKRLTTFSFGDRPEHPKGWGKLAAIYPFTIVADLKDALVILEFAAAHDTMKLL
jgi:hypothetical protein